MPAYSPLADRETKKSDRYWLPWLAALSDARIGEMAQLWGCHVLKTDGIDVMQIAPAPDGGSLKNEVSERRVPIHPALIERGFLDFVLSKGAGPLFYGGGRKGISPSARRGTKRTRGAKLSPKATDSDTLAVKRHASKGVTNHLAAWIRENGFTDKRKAPNHALRHWFKNACRRAGVLDSVADDIQGHSGKRGEADRYRHADIAVMYDAVRRIPVPRVRGDKTGAPEDPQGPKAHAPRNNS